MIKLPDGNYQTITTEDALRELTTQVLDTGHFAIDVETTSIEQMTCDLVGISITARPGEGFYIPVGHLVGEQLSLDVVRPYVAMLCASDNLVKVFFNATFDMVVLARHDMPVSPPVYDTRMLVWSQDNGKVHRNGAPYRYTLEAVVRRRYKIAMLPIKSLLGVGKKAVTFDHVSIEQATEYAAADVDLPMRLYLGFKGDELAGRKLQAVDMPLLPVLSEINMTGILLDQEMLKQTQLAYQKRMSELQFSIDVAYQLFHSDKSLLISSYQQLSRFLFNELKLRPDLANRRSKAGYFSTAAPRLHAISDQHPVVTLILEWRELSYMMTHYMTTLVNSSVNGRIHTNLNPVTLTSRLSSSGPNLQNIITRDVGGEYLRRAFIAPPDHVWLKVDYSQVELRVLAHVMSKLGDESYADIFRQGDDIHRATAAVVLGIPQNEVTKLQRRRAKSVNFGLIFGMTAAGLSHDLGVSYSEAEAFIQRYFVEYPGLRAWMDWQTKLGDRQGYVETPFFGLRRVIPVGERTLQLNSPIQGGAAEIIRRAMIDVHDALQAYETKMLLQVHDELDFEVPVSELSEVALVIKLKMENCVQLRVPLIVDVEVGQNWHGLKEL